MYPLEVTNEVRLYKASPVPYASRRKVDDALDDLLDQGVIEPVKFSKYACPIML